MIRSAANPRRYRVGGCSFANLVALGFSATALIIMVQVYFGS